MTTNLFKFPTYLVVYFVLSLGYSQQIEIKEGAITFENYQPTSKALQDLIVAFGDDKSLNSEHIMTLYGDSSVSNMNDWYQKEVGFEYQSLGDLEITPKDYRAFDRYQVFVYYISPETAEGFEGERVSYRFLVNNAWSMEYGTRQGKDLGAVPLTYEESSSVSIEGTEIKQSIIQRSPGLLYYLNKPIEIPISSQEVTEIKWKMSIGETGEIEWNEEEPIVKILFEIENGFNNELEESGNGDSFISTILSDTDIEYDKQVSLLEFIVAKQFEILDEVKPNSSFLKIVGSNIWIRDSPSDGEVVMKLNDGDVCLVLEKGKYEEIREMKDYWYRIAHKGDEGWIYGSQTTLKSTGIEIIEEFQKKESQPTTISEKELQPSSLETPFVVLVAVISVAFLFGFVWIIQMGIRKLSQSNEETKDVSDYLEDEEIAPSIRNQMIAIINRLDLERIPYLQKAKRVFPVSFRNCLVVLYALFLTFSIYVDLEENRPTELKSFLFPLVPTLILSLILSGVYTMFRKGNLWLKFSDRFKQELVQPVLKLVNPALTHQIDGISEEEYKASDLFKMYLPHFDSSDKISGSVNNNVTFSICEVDQSSKKYLPKGIRVTQTDSVVEKSDRYTCFKGLFLILDFGDTKTDKPVKILYHETAEKSLIREENDSLFSWYPPAKYYSPLLNRVDPNHKVETELLDGKYHVFAEKAEDAKIVMSDKFEKILAYVGNKYGFEKVVISICGSKLYLALRIDKNLFETETLLSKSLKESNIVERIYNDLRFANQLSKELSVFAS